ncbi:hypothetical protein [Glaciecola petra]|uniref:Uncharacterized protein n=1 Tax=Glaciecola petra TaxID=3075602 RepID=A0ABU2ZLV7_9ALTE|nr:hypothetical protein [Aestuariibacter sp. P117]MDT0593613.1 hypothetical protein [Aestuariibacter sp. P117]
MTITAVTVTEPSGYARKQQHLRFSLPLEASLLKLEASGTLALQTCVRISDNDNALVFQAVPLTYWQDGSVKWLQFSTFVDIGANESKSLKIEINTDENDAFDESNTIKSSRQDTLHQQSQISPNFAPKGPLNLLQFNDNNECVKLEGNCNIDINGHKHTAIIDNIRHKQQASIGTPFVSVVNLSGSFIPEDLSAPTSSIKFECEYTINQQNRHIATAFTLHNPEASEHPGGLWDLGDKNSVEVIDLCFHFVSKKTISIDLTNTEDPESGVPQKLELPVILSQLNSGGEKFDSINHVDKHQRLSKTEKGYKLVTANHEFRGQRISPTFSLISESKQHIHHLKVQDFWQNFPKSISIKDNECIVNLFPSHIELQPGEKKTHYFEQLFGTDAATNISQNSLICAIKPDWIQKTGVLPFFSPTSISHPLNNIVKEQALEGSHNFFQKREAIDEYGWRHFGDLYADHETSRQKDENIFISHYNNQYDPIFGFMQQYLKDNDIRWLNLAYDLAKHVLDIDIYHTNKDKAEYNNGLFWHTDHYNQAHTCTHRTFSKHQSEAAYGNQQGGGGPGGQHCYTSGLMLHYCMTGNLASKQAVLKLTEWITNVYEGSGSIFEFLLRFKNRHFGDYRNVVTNKYPFDRGSANYVIALLDSYYVSNDSNYLTRARKVIEHTISADDLIEERGLDNPETTWFYIVFLQACARYIFVSRQSKLDQLDGNVLNAFCKYIEWMLEHEKPFLESAEKLEFVNATWVAQDTRKAWLYDACLWLDIIPKQKQTLLQKSQFFKTYIVDYLNASDEKHYTRILVLLLQNVSAFEANSAIEYSQKNTMPINGQAIKYDTLTGNVFKLLKRFSLKREVSWLKKRLR